MIFWSICGYRWGCDIVVVSSFEDGGADNFPPEFWCCIRLSIEMKVVTTIGERLAILHAPTRNRTSLTGVPFT